MHEGEEVVKKILSLDIVWDFIELQRKEKKMSS